MIGSRLRTARHRHAHELPVVRFISSWLFASLAEAIVYYSSVEYKEADETSTNLQRRLVCWRNQELIFRRDNTFST